MDNMNVRMMDDFNIQQWGDETARTLEVAQAVENAEGVMKSYFKLVMNGEITNYEDYEMGKLMYQLSLSFFEEVQSQKDLDLLNKWIKAEKAVGNNE